MQSRLGMRDSLSSIGLARLGAESELGNRVYSIWGDGGANSSAAGAQGGRASFFDPPADNTNNATRTGARADGGGNGGACILSLSHTHTHTYTHVPIACPLESEYPSQSPITKPTHPTIEREWCNVQPSCVCLKAER